MFSYDLEKYWTGYHGLKVGLEAIAQLQGDDARAARSAAVQVLQGGAVSSGLPAHLERLLTEVFAGLNTAERALLGHPSEGANVGLASDAETDRAGLKDLVDSFISKHG